MYITGYFRTVSIRKDKVRERVTSDQSIKEVKHEATLKRLEESEQLFLDTINPQEETVAVQIEKVHAEESTALHYNKLPV